ncbi:MAG: RagB/SusD family nutrient uptake outer membrane protein [Bacteroidales bacterium]
MKINYISLFTLVLIALTSCFNELEQAPMSDDYITEIDVYSSPEQARHALIKIYAAYALSGQQGSEGNPDIVGGDEAKGQFFRALSALNVMTTDEAIIRSSSFGARDLTTTSWAADNLFAEALYKRLGIIITYSNSFIDRARDLSEDKETQYYIAEARFLRAYAYMHLMDLFGRVPLETKVSNELPEQVSRETLFNFVEGELIELTTLLKDDGTNEYGRVSKAAANATLSRLYLNAEVYTGTPMYDKCIEYCEATLASGYYKLFTTDVTGNGSSFDELFMADNNENGAQVEMMFTLNYDGQNSQTNGGSSYWVLANTLLGMSEDSLGAVGGWQQVKICPELVNKFTPTRMGTDAKGDVVPLEWRDSRALFATAEESRGFIISEIAGADDGYGTYKFRNVRTDGRPTNDPGKYFADIDVPLIRMGEIYLNYAEAILRTDGDKNTTLQYINELRKRANAELITVADLDLDFILDERARELYLECFRRPDLIRFGKFTTGYNWTFKGGEKAGKDIDEKFNLFAIPTSVLMANDKLTQHKDF